MHRREDNPQCACGAESEKVWAITHRDGQGSYPYITRNIDPTGKPIEVTDAGHERVLMKQFGLSKRDDVAWLEKEYGGYDLKTGKQKYREGSGRGLPGQWV